nr:ribonuclease H-like domain-containing protein [Tanacetum cinerariifolium]
NLEEIGRFSPTNNATSIEDNVVYENIVYRYADDPNMPDLEEIGRFSDSENDDPGADMNNLVTYFQDLKPYGKRAIGSKWVFRNKSDESGIVIRNKERLVAYGHTQEEGIDYDEVFAPVARIEAIRLFQAYASFKDFVLYQMDVKSDFLYGNIEKEKEYGIFISQNMYVNEILNKFGFSDVKTASTPIETHKTFLKDVKGEDVDKQFYRSMIRSLMYLTSLRPDIMFAATAKVKNINREAQLHDKVDGKKLVISEASIKRDL